MVQLANYETTGTISYAGFVRGLKNVKEILFKEEKNTEEGGVEPG